MKAKAKGPGGADLDSVLGDEDQEAQAAREAASAGDHPGQGQGDVASLDHPEDPGASSRAAGSPRLQFEIWSIDWPVEDPQNARLHPERNLEEIRNSLRLFGQQRPILVRRDRTVIAGNGTLRCMREMGFKEIAVVVSPLDADRARAFGIVDNRTGELARWNVPALLKAIEDLETADISPEDLGFVGTELEAAIAAAQEQENPEAPDESAPAQAALSLRERFLVPPFSVLDARAGGWRERKRAWMGLGIRSEGGRQENLLKYSGAINSGGAYKEKAAWEEKRGAAGTWAEFLKERPDLVKSGGTSIFDPVLCELVYRWFSPPGGAVLDPFAGGSVRGIVAGALGRRYYGIDLREEQISENERQLLKVWPAIAKEQPFGDPHKPHWLLGDSRTAIAQNFDPKAPVDLVFSCPPYFDMERYSDDGSDLSNLQSYEAFRGAYEHIICNALAILAENRFAVFVVGDIRAKDNGFYRSFVADTITAFRPWAGFYGEMILATPLGGAGMRAARPFGHSRKVTKVHQNVLVFCKGDPVKATEACGPVDLPTELPQEWGASGEEE